MAQVTIEVNGKPYTVGCDDGQEAHLSALAALLDRHVGEVAKDMGQLGETRLLLMGALLLADELHEVQARLDAARNELARAQNAQAGAEAKAIGALSAAAERIERIAAA
ncbi:MAG: cell division protein ZapA [Caulobacteraceae bacterium]|nr:cell division protein ZapA [Caulobacteraceae bacterium]